jgi:hypothetical protein
MVTILYSSGPNVAGFDLPHRFQRLASIAGGVRPPICRVALMGGELPLTTGQSRKESAPAVTIPSEFTDDGQKEQRERGPRIDPIAMTK